MASIFIFLVVVGVLLPSHAQTSLDTMPCSDARDCLLRLRSQAGVIAGAAGAPVDVASVDNAGSIQKKLGLIARGRPPGAAHELQLAVLELNQIYKKLDSLAAQGIPPVPKPVEGSRESVLPEEVFDKDYPERDSLAQDRLRDKVENLTKTLQMKNDSLQEALLELDRRRRVAEAANLTQSIVLQEYLMAHAETVKANNSLNAMRPAIESARMQKDIWYNKTVVLRVKLNESQSELANATWALREIQVKGHIEIKHAIANSEHLKNETLRNFTTVNISLFQAEDDVDRWRGRLQKEVAKLNAINDELKEYEGGIIEAPQKLVDAVHEQAELVSNATDHLENAQKLLRHLTSMRDEYVLKLRNLEEATNKSRQNYEGMEKNALRTKEESAARYNETKILYENAQFRYVSYTREKDKLSSMLELPETLLHVAILEELYVFQRWQNSSAVSVAADNSLSAQKIVVKEMTLKIHTIEKQLVNISSPQQVRTRSQIAKIEPVQPGPPIYDARAPGKALPALVWVLGVSLIVVLCVAVRAQSRR